MDRFLLTAVNSINRHGLTMTYTKVQEGTYDVETGSITSTDTNYTIKMYKKHIKSNQYNYPNLIGKSAAVFYLANNNLSFVPNIRDKITVNGETFNIDEIIEHSASGAIALYKLIAVKG